MADWEDSAIGTAKAIGKDGVEGTKALTEEGKALAEAFSRARDQAEGVAKALLGTSLGSVSSGEALRTLTPEKAVEGYTDFLGVGWLLRGEGKRPSSSEIEGRAREVIETPLSRVFNDAMVQGLEGGNFFKALGDGIKRVFIENLANQITGAIFGQSGAIAGILGGSGGASGGGGGGGLLGGLFQPLRHSAAAGGGINWGGLGTNLLIGGAMSWLSSPGRLFGGTVQNGTEAIGQAGDINTQVSAATNQQTQLLTSTIGISKETAEQLQRLTLWTAGYTVSHSGDGIFSKKTDTYALDSGQATTSLAQFADLAAQAAYEVGKRQYDEGIMALTDSTEATRMAIQDLHEFLLRRTGNENGTTTGGTSTDPEMFQYRLQLAQLQKQLDQAVQAQVLARAGRAFDFLVGTPGAGSPSSDLMQTATTRTGYSTTGQIQMDNGAWVDAGTYRQLQEFGMMLPGMKQSAESQFNLQSAQIGAADNPEAYQAALEDRQKEIVGHMATLQTLMDDAAKQAENAALTMEARQQAFQDYQKALQAYYSDKLENLSIEQEQEALVKQKLAEQKGKLDTLTADILGTMLTHLGEVTTNAGGQQVIVLSGGQPDGKALATQLKDALAGSNPELAGVLEQFINAVNAPRWG